MEKSPDSSFIRSVSVMVVSSVLSKLTADGLKIASAKAVDAYTRWRDNLPQNQLPQNGGVTPSTESTANRSSHVE